MKSVKCLRYGVKMRGSGGTSSGLLRRHCPVRLALAAVRRDGVDRALEEFPCWPMPVSGCERRRAPYDDGIRLAFDPVVLICRSGECVFSWCMARS